MNLTAKRMLKTLVLVICIFLGLVIFQNCAPPKSQSVEQSSAAGLVAANAFTVGECGPMINTCRSGSFSNIADSNTHSWWRCNGSGGGASTSCSLPLTTSGPINGVCTNTYNFCFQGDLLDVADTANEYVWNCRGINSGSTAVCRIPKPTDPNAIAGQCGVNRNTCVQGVFSDTSDTASEFRWECHGINGGINTSCSQNISTAPVSGTCGSATESCVSGDYEDNPDTNINFVWTCRGRNGGNTNTCFIPKPTCTLSGSAQLFFGEDNVYTVRATTGTLPSQIEVRYYGTKSNMNGTGTVNDANGEQVNTRIVSPNAPMTFLYREPSEAGVYTRYAKLFLPGTQKELCQTNTLNQNLLPLCTLAVNRSTGNLSEEFNFSAVFPAANHRELAASPSSVIWTSTRTISGSTAPDELNGMQTSASVFPMRYIAGTANTTYIGLYNRFFVARDSNNRVLCKSNTISYEITAMPTPPTEPLNPTNPDIQFPDDEPPIIQIPTGEPVGGGSGGGSGGGGFNQNRPLQN